MPSPKSFQAIAHDIIHHPNFQKMKIYKHHQHSLYHHSLSVAFTAYKISKRFGLDYVSTTRAALLHDYFLYDWRIEGKRVKKRGFKRHGFTHSRTALHHASKDFSLNSLEKDAILKHMFPLTPYPPKGIESWIVNLSDTYVTLKESFHYFYSTLKDKFSP